MYLESMNYEKIWKKILHRGKITTTSTNTKFFLKRSAQLQKTSYSLQGVQARNRVFSYKAWQWIN